MGEGEGEAEDGRTAPFTLFGCRVVYDSTVPSPSEVLRGVRIGPFEMLGVAPEDWPEGAARPILADEPDAGPADQPAGA